MMPAPQPSVAPRPPQGAAKPRAFLMNHNLSTGGTERQFALLAQALRGGAFEVELACLVRTGAFLEGLGEVREFSLGGSFFTLQAQRARWRLARHLRAQGVAVAHSFDFYSNLMLIPTAWLARVPVVIGSKRHIGDQLSSGKRAAVNAAFRLCDRVVCNSRAGAERLVREGLAPARVVVIPNGLPETAFASVAPALPPRPPVVRVGLVGRMNDPVKNQALLLRAAARLRPQFPGVEYLLVGDGALRPGLEKMAVELGLGGQVRFLGERRDIPAVLAAVDISVVTSVSESLSNVILESMAAGKPVVATRVGGNSELVEEGATGLLVRSNDEEEFAAALLRLLTRPDLRAEWGERAREVARSRFGVQRVREQYEQLYAEVLAEKGWSVPAQASTAVSGRAGRRLRVALVAPSLRQLGGQSVQADLLLRQWRNDPEVEVRFIATDTQMPFPLAWVQRIPFLRTVVRAPFYLLSLWRGLKGADIAHIFSASYWSFLLAPAPAWAVARLRGKKTIINYRSGEARDHLKRWRTGRGVLRRAGRLVVPSGYLVDVFREFGLPASVVPNIVDLEQFTFRLRQPLRPVLVCTRNFEPYYRVDLVVRAFAGVQREFPQARLLLVGGGKLAAEIRGLVQESGVHGVEFAGAVPREAIGREYDRADIFVNASSLDNMPVSILEAFAAGTPVVTTAPEGIRYIVEHERTGLLCAPGDWPGLAAGVVRLLRTPQLAERLARNGQEESRRYRWEAVREQWLAVYRALLPAGAAEEVTRGAGVSPGSVTEGAK